MYYKYDYKKLHVYAEETKDQVNEWLTQLVNIQKALEGISSTSKISGAGADNIKSYFTVAHGLILSNLQELVRMHLGILDVYEQDYLSMSDTKSHVETKETESISKNVEKQRNTVNELTREINRTLSSISDLISLSHANADSIQASRDKVQKFIRVLNELIDKIEQSHSKNDFNVTEQSIQRTKTLIVSLQNAKDFPDTFDKNAFYSTKEFGDFYDSAVEVDDSYNANIDVYKAAAESHQAAENVYIAERERQAELIKLGLVVVTTAVGVVVSVATAGAASPLVAAGVSALVSAGSAAVTTVADNALEVYVMDGDLDNLDMDQTLRDAGKAAVIAGATSLIGSGVSAGVESGLTTAVSKHGLYGLANSSAGRIGAGVCIGATSKVVEGVSTRTIEEFADNIVEWDETGVHLSKENSVIDSMEKATKKGFDLKEMGKDAAYGGVSGGIKEQKNIRKEKYESAVANRESMKQEASGEDLDYVETKQPEKHKTSNAYKTNSKSEREIIQDMHDSGEWDDIQDYDDVPVRKQSVLTKEIVGDKKWVNSQSMENARDAGDLNKRYKNFETGVKTTTKISGKIGAESEETAQEQDTIYDYSGKKIYKR